MKKSHINALHLLAVPAISAFIACAAQRPLPESGAAQPAQKTVPPTGSNTPRHATTLRKRMQERLELVGPQLVELRHDLHRHPEPSGEEARTAERIADRLRLAGLTVTTGVGGHGVVGLLQGGRPGPVVAYRADMDAVRTTLPDPAPFASTAPGVRHICGHDIHVATAIGIAEALSGTRADLPGSIKFIFQPAEENTLGAKAMLEAGVLDNPRPRAIFAVHTAPLPVGMMSCSTGMALPGLDFALVRVRGKGDLEPMVRSLEQTITAVSTVPALGSGGPVGGSGFLEDFIWVQVTPGDRQGDAWAMQVFVRASSAANHAKAKQGIEQAVARAQRDDLHLELDYHDRTLLAAMNNGALVQQIVPSLRRVLGEEHTIITNGTVPYFGEDFAYFQEQVPGVLCFLGVSNPTRGILGVPHAPFYQADDGAILVGARAMSHVLLDYLENGSP